MNLKYFDIDIFIGSLSDIELNTFYTLTHLGLAGVCTELPRGAAQAALLWPALPHGPLVTSVRPRPGPWGVRGTGGIQPRRGNLII